MLFRSVQLLAADQRTHDRLGIARIADADRRQLAGGRFCNGMHHCFGYQRTARRSAALAALDCDVTDEIVDVQIEGWCAGQRILAEHAPGLSVVGLDDVPTYDEPVEDAPDNERRAQLIVDTLASFGVDAKVTQINEGPTITQFGVEPGWDVRTKNVVERDANGQPLLDASGEQRVSEVEVSRTRIRVNRITQLQNDLALALATPALRIEAPVPGKSIVGIEVPNGSASIVTMREVMESAAFQKALTTHAQIGRAHV